MNFSAQPIQNKKSARATLRSEFLQRKKRNPAYSIRAFARDLGVSKSVLAEVLAARRWLSTVNASRIAAGLKLGPKETEFFVNSATNRLKAPAAESLELREDQFQFIAEWYYLAILNLATCEENFADHRWIAKRLAISEVAAQDAIERLVRLKLLEIRDDRLVRLCPWIETTNNISSVAIRKHHAGLLERSADALENIPIEARYFDAITVAIDKEKSEQIKLAIREFRNKISRLVEDIKSPRTDVYTLAFQFFPQTRD